MHSVEQKLGAAKNAVMEKTGMGHSHATEASASRVSCPALAAFACYKSSVVAAQKRTRPCERLRLHADGSRGSAHDRRGRRQPGHDPPWPW